MNSKCGFLTKFRVDERRVPGSSFSVDVKGVDTLLLADAFGRLMNDGVVTGAPNSTVDPSPSTASFDII